MRDDILFILPVYGKFGYARRAAHSFFAHTPNGHVLVVDDASPDFDSCNWDRWAAEMPSNQLHFHRYTKNGGLTRSWNYGLRFARTLGSRYAIAGNSDVVFTPGWHNGLRYHLENGVRLVGPVTNTPGPTNHGAQHVKKFFPGYKVRDDESSLAEVAHYLATHIPQERIVETAINGFFQMALVDTWWTGCFSAENVYNPANRMTGNEDELQRRWRAKGWKIGFVPSSFVFHYRAVTRGSRYCYGDWMRSADLSRPV